MSDPNDNTVNVGCTRAIDTEGSCSTKGQWVKLIQVPNSMSKRQCVRDTVSFSANVLEVIIDSSSNEQPSHLGKLLYRPRKCNLSSRFRENGTDVNQDISSKMQNMRHRYHYENASTSSNRPQGTVDPSIPPMDTSGNCAHHTGPPSGYVHVGLIELQDNHNALVQLFRTAHEKILDSEVPSFKIRLYSVVAAHEYELPMGDAICWLQMWIGANTRVP
ncbi:hypothetical protein Tco_0427662 [Tanacetum coccineum]